MALSIFPLKEPYRVLNPEKESIQTTEQVLV
jgi:hypothetical protein